MVEFGETVPAKVPKKQVKLEPRWIQGMWLEKLASQNEVLCTLLLVFVSFPL